MASSSWTQDLANRALEHTSSVLALGVPANMELGIDLRSWTVGELFKGLKLIPPGVHYVWYCLSNRHGGEGGLRTGFFVKLEADQVMVLQWDAESETLVPEKDEEQAERLRKGVRAFDFDKNLGPYPLDMYKQWQMMTNFITAKTLKRVLPPGGTLNPNAQPLTEKEKQKLGIAVDGSGEGDDEEEARQEEQRKFREKFSAGIPLDNEDRYIHDPISPSSTDATTASSSSTTKPPASFNVAAAMDAQYSGLTYTLIDLKAFSKGVSGEALTQLHFDQTALVEALFVKVKSKEELLAELQLAFVAFLVGESFDSFEQWKKIIVTLCGSQTLISRETTFYSTFIDMLRVMVAEVPRDFFDNILSGDNFLLKSLVELFSSISPTSALSPIAKSLQKYIEKLFSVQIEPLLRRHENADGEAGEGDDMMYLDDDDDAPTIVIPDNLEELGLTKEELAAFLASIGR
eukprot:TRINITY_DN8708_c0_g1_i1.p1 TRINITY_DN8708_c0_g1~~TRINITY_DN8708_c0_g1_i1.p1  ORF type:complete len:460 (+),score=119.79 TRINITY_DN8708_c0_g1_i1:222-1601(+)